MGSGVAGAIKQIQGHSYRTCSELSSNVGGMWAQLPLALGQEDGRPLALGWPARSVPFASPCIWDVISGLPRLSKPALSPIPAISWEEQ